LKYCGLLLVSYYCYELIFIVRDCVAAVL